MRQLEKLTKQYKNYFFIILLSLFSFLINFHYGFIGVMPMDNFVLYNGGFKILKGYIPFNDYWLVTGPLLDYLNALIFYLIGVTWKSFIIHSSIINCLVALLNYKLFKELGLSIKISLFYSALFSILFYPVVGTPFVDHHSTFFSLIAFYFFIFSIKKDSKSYLFFIPFFLVLSFLSKQTPAAYILFSLIFLGSIYFYISKDKKIIFWTFFYGSIFSILFLLTFFFFTKINLQNFFLQYLYFAGSIGEFRFSETGFSLKEIFSSLKFIIILLIIFLIITFKLFFYYKKINNEILILISINVLTLTMIVHQQLTFNQEFIFFLIPLLTAAIHAYYYKVFKNKVFLTIIIFISIFAVTKYHLRFNEHRKFNELEKIDLSKAVDSGSVLHKSLDGLKWISYRFPDNPEEELKELKTNIEIIKKDKSNKSILTDYQIIGPILNEYDFSPNQWHHPTVSFPVRNQKYYLEYRNYFIRNLLKNKIENIYEINFEKELILPLVIEKDCFVEEIKSKSLTKFKLIKSCEDFKINENN